MASLRGGISAVRVAVVGILSLALALGWARPAQAVNAGFLILNGALSGEVALAPSGTVGTFLVNLTPFLVLP